MHLGFEKEVIEFVTIFHFLNHSCFMCEFKVIMDLFCILKVKTILKKYWMNNSEWGMATTTNHGLLDQNFW